MAVISIEVMFKVYNIANSGIYTHEFFRLLMIDPRRPIASQLITQTENDASITLASKFSRLGVDDETFESWSADTFEHVIHIINKMPTDFIDMCNDSNTAHHAGLIIVMIHNRDFPIVDFPIALYAICKRCGFRLHSTTYSIDDIQDKSQPFTT